FFLHNLSSRNWHSFIFTKGKQSRNLDVLQLISEMPVLQLTSDDKFVITLECVVNSTTADILQVVKLRRLLTVNEVNVQDLDIILVTLVVVVIVLFAFMHKVDFSLRKNFLSSSIN